MGAAVVHTEAHLQNVGFPLGQGVQNLLQGLGQQSIGGGIGGTGGPLVLHKGADGGVLFVTDRGVQGQGIRGGVLSLLHF